MKSTDPDTRWHQRLANYSRALQRLTSATQLAAQRPLSELEQQGLIQAFEFTHELAWNVMRDYFFWQGTTQNSPWKQCVTNKYNPHCETPVMRNTPISESHYSS